MSQLRRSRKHSPLLPLLVSLLTVVLLAVMVLHSTASHAALPKTRPPATHGHVNIIQLSTQVIFSSNSLTLTHSPKNRASVYFSNQTTTTETILGSNLLIFPVPAGQQVRINVPIGQITFTLQANATAHAVITVN
jgi:hypothetical protein